MGVAERRRYGAGECLIMKTRHLVIVVVLAAGAGAAAYATRSSWMDVGSAAKAQAQGPARPRTVAVQVASAERKQIPFEVDAIGTVSPIASVALKSRIETTITEVHFEDGARVKDLLVDVGDADPFLEQQLRPELLERACAEAGIALTLRVQPGYDHSYYFVSTFMRDHMRWHAERLR